MPEPQILQTGVAMGECPRWRDGRLWFADWGAQEIRAVDLAGRSEVIRRGSFGLPFSFDWLPDGRMLIVSGGLLLRQEADGSLATHADLRAGALGVWNEIAAVARQRTGRVLTAQAPAPRAGWP
jgi:sugar lactone lactonase YvrE